MTHTQEYMRAWRAKKAGEGRCHGCFRRPAGIDVGKFKGTQCLCGLCAAERRAWQRWKYVPVERELKKTLAPAPKTRSPKPPPLSREEIRAQRETARIERMNALIERTSRRNLTLST
jgi:hypothetical protein